MLERRIIHLVEKYAKKALENHQNGMYRILLEDIQEDMDGEYVSGSLLAEILDKDERFKYAEMIDDEIIIVLPVTESMVEEESGITVAM